MATSDLDKSKDGRREIREEIRLYDASVGHSPMVFVFLLGRNFVVVVVAVVVSVGACGTSQISQEGVRKV